ncbi:polyprenyl synthetase family protein [Pararhizobium haloflavum]|uniref:polyprenyl synthetase family protein n=1 Tax=Pararhizobium haloflavum TaxID=2037914 RepID=UPI000C17CC2D|nr:farnesyl diphosphate synthase [Pararhizobium haloflavum]
MDTAAIDFEQKLALSSVSVEARLAAHLHVHAANDEIARPERLLGAMRYAVLNGGKRLRPFLVLESTRLLTDDAALLNAALDVAAALECVHCYSLVHDDLPAMDDDALRRGMPTLHVAFDEATAILAGDALLTLAFDILAAGADTLPSDRSLSLVRALSRAAGLGGMAGGQMLDLQAEREQPDEAGIIRLQAMKTGALIRFACEAGAILTGATAEHRTRLRQFGETIGLAFQLADDLLDVTADASDLGKATGKDQDRGKATLVSMHGAQWAARQLDGLVAEAQSLLTPFTGRALTLNETARFVANRKR